VLKVAGEREQEVCLKKVLERNEKKRELAKKQIEPEMRESDVSDSSYHFKDILKDKVVHSEPQVFT